MRPELERLHFIEQQLLGTPTALSPDEWHLHQLLDGDLARDAARQQQLYDGLRLAGRRQLRRELQLIQARLYGPGRPGWLARLRHWWGS